MAEASALAADVALEADHSATTRLGVLVFLLTDAVSFATLIIAYAVLRAGASEWPARRLSLPLGAAMTALLLASSVSLTRAVRARHRRAWLMATACGGVAFLSGQAYEYHHLLASVMRPATDRMSASFFALTGFHGAHVLAGVVALLLTAGRARVSPKGVAALGLYWHFVDAVWIVLFTAVYLV